MVRQSTIRENSGISWQQIKNKQANKKLKMKVITLHQTWMKFVYFIQQDVVHLDYQKL